MEEEMVSPNFKASKSQVSFQDILKTDWDESVGKPTNSIKKNSLDSDEEDDAEEKKYDILDDDDIEGQEEGTAGLDGEVQITPFNMKEELEEGHFDTEGNYFWKKERLLRDNWLENIDWVQIKEPTGQAMEKEESDSDDDSGIFSTFDHIAVYKKMLELMKPGETVAKTLQRLGGNKTLTASERWKRKKAGQPLEDSTSQQVTEFTELANRLLYKMGNMDIYQEKYEEITLKVQSKGKKSAPVPPPKPSVADSDVLDMYADDFDVQEQQRRKEVHKKVTWDEMGESSRTNTGETAEKRKASDDVGESSQAKQAKTDVEDSPTSSQKAVESVAESPTSAVKEEETKEVKWEFKWERESTEIHGPHTSGEMQGWVDQGYFKEVWVRKCGTSGEFYTSKRIDFELYI